MPRCVNCGREHAEFNGYWRSGDVKPVCGICAGRYMASCTYCGTLYAKWFLRPNTNGTYTCTHCLGITHCDWCEAEHSSENAYYQVLNDDGEDVYVGQCCMSELRETYGTCAICHRYITTGTHCSHCNPETSTTKRIHNYSYCPRLLQFNKLSDRADLYLGIELEIDHPNKTSSRTEEHTAALELLPDFTFAKYDGSVAHGFEIVTHPMTYDWYVDRESIISDMLSGLVELGYVSATAGTCGMHIHMSKKAFGHFHLFKFLTLIYTHLSLTLLLSQRYKQQFEQWAIPNEDTMSRKKRAALKDHLGMNRHHAVNISRKDTVEVRIFNGTLNEYTFRKNVECVMAMYQFTMDSKLQDVTALNFVDYVEAHKDQYRMLNLFFQASKTDRRSIFHYDTAKIPERYAQLLGVKECV